jgi:hypothetical protein
VAEQAENFRALIDSLSFEMDQGQPNWMLPNGWVQKPASGMRFATIEVPAAKGSSELSVTPLRLAGELHDYVVANVDRWRQQLGLDPTSSAKLFGSAEQPGELKEVRLSDGEQVMIVDLTGKAAAGPAAGLAGSAPLPPTGGPAAAGLPPSRPSNGPRLTYDTPAGWSAGKVDGMRQVAFDIRDDGKAAEFTVIALAEGSGDLLANVNRWRQQVGLQPLAGRELGSQVKEFAVDGAPGQEVELLGPAEKEPQEAILGVICSRGGQVWYFKLKGDAALVQREREQFDAFMHSVKFPDRDGADHGQ